MLCKDETDDCRSALFHIDYKQQNSASMKKDEEMSEENYSHRRRIQKAELVTKDYTQAKGKLQEIK